MIPGVPMRTLTGVLIAIGSLLVVACSSSDASTSRASSTSVATVEEAQPAVGEPVPPIGFRSIIITITHPDGTTEQHCVWLAEDESSRRQGLMGVTDPGLGGRVGMLFRFPQDTTARFHMRDTLLPLSIAWFDGAGAFVSSTDMEPCPAGVQRCPTHGADGSYRLALEVPRGALPGLGVGERSRVEVGGSCS